MSRDEQTADLEAGENRSRQLAPVDLADRADFQLGPLRVRPSIRTVTAGATSHTLEPRVLQVLVALADADGETVSRRTLIERCWGGAHVSDDAVNRVIGQLRRLSQQCDESIHIVTIPRVGFRLQVSGRERPAADETQVRRSAEPSSWLRRIALGVAALVAIGIGFTSLEWAKSAVASRQGAERLAVLPFISAPDGGASEFSARLSARLRRLISDSAMPVMSRPDAAVFRSEGLPAAAKVSRVGFVLDGEAHAEGDDLVVSAELIDAAHNTTIWSKDFRRRASESEALAEQVAMHAAYVLRCALTPDRSSSGLSNDPVLLSAFLKACDLVHLYDGGRNETLESARLLTEKAPEYADGWFMYAMAAARASYVVPPEGAARLLEAVDRSLERGLKLDPDSAKAALVKLQLMPDLGSWREKEALIEDAVSKDERLADAHAARGDFLLTTGRLEDALASYQRAVALDPLSPMNQTNLVPTLSGLGRQEQAARERDRLYRIWPNSPRVWMHRLHNAAFPGKAADAERVLATMDGAPFPLEADVKAAFQMYLAAKAKGERSGLKRAAERYVELALDGRLDMAPAISALSEAGELDRAFDLAQRYFEGPSSSWVLFSPPTRAMRADRRMMRLAASIGFDGLLGVDGPLAGFLPVAKPGL